MALQTSGQISLNDVNVELGNSGTAQIGLGDTDVRDLFGIASGEIEMADGYGAAAVSIPSTRTVYADRSASPFYTGSENWGGFQAAGKLPSSLDGGTDTIFGVGSGTTGIKSYKSTNGGSSFSTSMQNAYSGFSDLRESSAVLGVSSDRFLYTGSYRSGRTKRSYVELADLSGTIGTNQAWIDTLATTTGRQAVSLRYDSGTDRFWWRSNGYDTISYATRSHLLSTPAFTPSVTDIALASTVNGTVSASFGRSRPFDIKDGKGFALNTVQTGGAMCARYTTNSFASTTEVQIASGESGFFGIECDCVVASNGDFWALRPMYNSTTNVDKLYLYKSTNGGASWSQVIEFISNDASYFAKAVSTSYLRNAVIEEQDGVIVVQLDYNGTSEAVYTLFSADGFSTYTKSKAVKGTDIFNYLGGVTNGAMLNKPFFDSNGYLYTNAQYIDLSKFT